MTGTGVALETVVYEGAEASQRLQELRLDLGLLLEVVEQGEQARAESTDHDPVTAAAWDAYRYRVRGLRDRFVPPPYEWTAAREDHLELLLSPCGRRAIVTRGGDEDTGRHPGHPQPLRQFGDATARAIETNATLLLCPDWMNVEAAVTDPDRETWMFLVHRERDRVRAELSHPSGTTADGRVAAWIERIILPELDFDPEAPGRDVAPAPAEIDVPVTRKR